VFEKQPFAHSPKVFRTACTGPFKVRNWCATCDQWLTSLQEASSNTYEMNENPLFAVSKMADYFNNGDYNLAAIPVVEEQDLSFLRIHARVFALADKYVVDVLQSLSVAKFSDRLRDSEIFEFLESIPGVYTLTPGVVRGLRDEAIKHARINLPQYLGNASVRQAYEDIASMTPEFIKELLESYMETPMIGKCWNCGRCQALQAVQSRCLRCDEHTLRHADKADKLHFGIYPH